MHGDACYERYGRESISERLIRRVWAEVTRTPSITVRALASQLGYSSWTDTSIALRVLRDAGYIHFEDRAAHARTIIVPFHTEGFRIVKRES